MPFQPGLHMAAGANGQRTRLICIPSFVTSGVLLLLNLSTLDVEAINFDAQLIN